MIGDAVAADRQGVTGDLFRFTRDDQVDECVTDDPLAVGVK